MTYRCHVTLCPHDPPLPLCRPSTMSARAHSPPEHAVRPSTQSAQARGPPEHRGRGSGWQREWAHVTLGRLCAPLGNPRLSSHPTSAANAHLALGRRGDSGEECLNSLLHLLRGKWRHPGKWRAPERNLRGRRNPSRHGSVLSTCRLGGLTTLPCLEFARRPWDVSDDLPDSVASDTAASTASPEE